ncbi:MAG TPA: serine hydrolase domain-containing protein [Pyrinomonadaceae bacterium]|nr:serine hydrolase domain-containing protein [Pyrinomonadaceae bacterium]
MIRVVLVFSVLLALTIAVSSEPSAPDASDRIRRVEAGLIPVDDKGQPSTPATIADRMRHYGIPSVSIAVINEGKVEWARGYGIADSPDTLFQACSLSKPIAGMAALQLVEEKKLNLRRWLSRASTIIDRRLA